ncbi:cytochrome b/b6 domain-containing protein [Pseudosulfitobacter koreensis]|uniref:Cytochrome b/b6 domain-containing protein n=1 Tax=Pseudosulfitobacter koreensis TaxID=2968472 RepID=A0ABT1YXQ9_9RHOB|nr:cytochrome b/b6 domain-containing protein [Pseudosulfitobacter koreense]MCR8825674.1 cytochrome b/b6 domain-containing protein [Pseudosulfitobacter koreense]
MPLTNARDRYGAVTKTFHWLIALLILTLIPLGLIANYLPYETSEQLATKAWLFSLHKTLGVTAFAVAVARILWAVTQTKPTHLHPERKLETFAAETVHWLLYASLVIVPLSGWIHHAAASGFAPMWLPIGQDLPLVPKSESLSHVFAQIHEIATHVLEAALALHILGALKHHFIDRDSTLRRMWFGTTTATSPGGAPVAHRSALAATAIWAVAIAFGAGLGLSAGEDARPGTPAALADVQSDWQVQDGTLSIVVNQFGSDVTGSFADWTADITFDETVQNGISGAVEATISIGSLTLGSVTNQAMGPDFFNVDAFPTATYIAEITSTSETTVARGTLTIKDQSVPLDLPFDLTIDGMTAVMRGSTTLDRRDFNIGDTMNDESSLKFPVDVQIELTATRN